MPTAYTAKIVKGDQGFEEFLYGAVRAMSPFIHQREDSPDSKLRLPRSGFTRSGSAEEIERSRAALEESRKELVDLEAMSSEQIEAVFVARKAQALREHEASCERIKPILARLAELSRQVVSWGPPTAEHKAFKEFMLSQISETIRVDASPPSAPVFAATPALDHAENITVIKNLVSYRERRLQDALKTPDVQAERIKWIRDLVASVPPPPGTFEPGALEA